METANAASKDETSSLAEKKPKVVFVLGGPGSGKGTQCANIVQHFGYTHLSAGDLLRAEKNSGSENGTMIQNMMNEGKIVPSEVTIKLLQKAMLESGNDKFLIDGFPRNEENRAAFESITKIEPEFVLFFNCPEEEMERRILNRNQGREDDNIETIRKRFKVFLESSLPVIEYYKAKGKVREIDAAKPIEEVFEAVKVIFTPKDEEKLLLENLRVALIEGLYRGEEAWLLKLGWYHDCILKRLVLVEIGARLDPDQFKVGSQSRCMEESDGERVQVRRFAPMGDVWFAWPVVRDPRWLKGVVLRRGVMSRSMYLGSVNFRWVGGNMLCYWQVVADNRWVWSLSFPSGADNGSWGTCEVMVNAGYGPSVLCRSLVESDSLCAVKLNCAGFAVLVFQLAIGFVGTAGTILFPY
ncbi:hypothetical protein REPUB_Repub13aG0044700 [Reevesia pubescens]